MAKRGRKRKTKLKKETVNTIISTVFLSTAGLIMLSFAKKGSLLVAFNGFLNDIFGIGIFLLPFLFICAGLMLTNLKWRLAKETVLIGALLVFFSGIGVFKSGLVGYKIWTGLAGLISGLGAGIVLLGSLFVGIIVLFETSLMEMAMVVGYFLKTLKKNVSIVFTGKKDFKISKADQMEIKGLDKEKAEPRQTQSKPHKKEEVKTQEDLSSQLVSTIPAPDAEEWQYPPLNLLEQLDGEKADSGDLKKNAAIIEKTLESFGIEASVVEVNCGPAVTQYALEIALGTKLSKITALSNDLALALAAPQGQIRIEAPIPGRSLVGVEIPNRSLEVVRLRQILTSERMKKASSKLSIGLGLDVSGKPLIADISDMPHVLIAGATGSGKSVAINSIISTVLFRAAPYEVKLILVDPKRVELTQYNGIPHLLTPVIVEPDKVISALKWTVAEMERRYKVFAKKGARNIKSYNRKSKEQNLPYILVIIDELADIMYFAPSEVEDTITRIAQMARATGIHLIVSTQRPSVDVLTGLIKANIPCRVAFNVSSMVDSRVIIDSPGAEKLLGRGDMLYIPPSQSKPTRIQGTFVADKEIQNLIEYLRDSGVGPVYTEEVTSQYETKTIASGVGGQEEEKDELFDDAVRAICNYGRGSASLLQRRLSIGYARAARILDQLHTAGVVGPAEGSKARELLVKDPEKFLAQQK